MLKNKLGEDSPIPISKEDSNHLFMIINNMTVLMNSRHSYKGLVI